MLSIILSNRAVSGEWLAMPQMWDSEQICPRNGLLSQGGGDSFGGCGPRAGGIGQCSGPALLLNARCVPTICE